MIEIPNLAFTHGGRFHADDVFSAALLQLCNPAIQIKRGYQVPEGFDGLVFDIGFGPYDHHQKDAEKRTDGTPYAAFGLLWRAVGKDLLGSEKEANRFDEYFVSPLDLDDNTGCGNQLANVIAAYNPAWDSEEDADTCFLRAVEVAKDLLGHKLESIRSVLRAAEEVTAALSNARHGIVQLNRFAPWKQQLIPSKAKFVVFPSQRGGYCAQGVPANFGRPDLKIPFPAFWAGLSEEELPAASGIDGLRFCHAGRFLITAATKQDAIDACYAAMELRE